MRCVPCLLVALASAAPCCAGTVSATVSPAFEGWFRAGWPVLLRVALGNEGAALDGTLDVTVEGVTYRLPAQVGAQTRGTVEALVVVHSESARARVAVRSAAGEVVFDGVMELGLHSASGDSPLVAWAGAGGKEATRLFGDRCTAVSAGELPGLAAGYSAVDAVLVAGDGSGVPPGALVDWVRGGGLVAFVLEGGAPVRAEGVLARLGEVAGRATAEEWLSAVAGVQATRRLNGARVWRVGLGKVAAGTKGELAKGAFAGLIPTQARGDVWVDKGVYDVFGPASWSLGVRWRLVGGVAVLLAAGAMLARFASRRRWALAGGAVLGLAAGLTALAWAVGLPGGRCVLGLAGVLERVAGEQGGWRTELVGVAATGPARARLDFGAAEAVVPVYYSAADAGGWGDVVVARDGSGRWSVECGVTGGVRRGFAGWWAWTAASGAEEGARAGSVLVRDGEYGVAGAGGGVPTEGWRPLSELSQWGEADRALVRWQARRARPGRTYLVSWQEVTRSAVSGTRLLEERKRPTLVWTEAVGGTGAE